MTLAKGCVIRSTVFEDNSESETNINSEEISFWQKILLCQPCTKSIENCDDAMWKLAVCCSRISPGRCNSSLCCNWLDRVGIDFIYKPRYFHFYGLEYFPT